MSEHNSLAARLYRGEVSYDFIARRRRWYLISGIVILVSIASLLIRGINPSIDFKGGAVFQLSKNHHSVAQVRDALASVGVTDAIVQVTGSGGDQRFRIQTPPLKQEAGNDQVGKVETKLADAIGVDKASIDVSTIGSSWGSQITKKAVTGLIVFLIVAFIYLSLRFEWKMAASAMIALVHDLLITAGIYSLVGFEVSPSTVIALLTILGYSLYDTVVVFDKVRENTAGIAGGSRLTFSGAANLAVNQTLVRSINTSIIALLPVAGLLIIGAGFLGAGSLKDLALALLIGLAAGTYSSIFIATPLLCDFKEREPAYRQLARRVAARQAKEPTPAAVPARAAVATDPPDDTDIDESDAAMASSAAGARGERPAARPQQRQQQRRKGGRPGGRGGRPSGRKRR